MFDDITLTTLTTDSTTWAANLAGIVSIILAIVVAMITANWFLGSGLQLLRASRRK